MSSLKEVVNRIFLENTGYETPQQAVNQAYSLNALSDDLYTDRLRFIFELIQNCDDAYDSFETTECLLRIALIQDSYLIVGHYGKGFDEHDLRAVCRVGFGTKRNDLQKTGYKGLGFKSVFGQSNYVLIASKGEFFRFDQSAEKFVWSSRWVGDQKSWETENGQVFQYPWQICPIWTARSKVPEVIQQFLFAQPKIVAYCIRVADAPSFIDSIETLISQSHVFMFLRQIREILISTRPDSEKKFIIKPMKDGSIKICDGQLQSLSHWLLYKSELKVTDEALRDKSLPEKFKTLKMVTMTLAMKIDKDDRFEPVKGTSSVLFAFLPTRISNYAFPFLVNTPFLVNASREQILLDSSWNQWLFSCIPEQTFKWIGQLITIRKWANKAYDLLPNPSQVQDCLARHYNKSLEQNKSKVPFLLSINGMTTLHLHEAVIDLTSFSSEQCLGHTIVRNYLMETKNNRSVLANNPFVFNHHRLDKLKIQTFSWEMLEHLLANILLPITKAIDLINYVYGSSNKITFNNRLYQLPFLMDQNGRLRNVSRIFFMSRFSSADWMVDDMSDSYIHPEIMNWLQTRTEVRDWLKKLGIAEKTDLTFVQNYILPNADHYICRENAEITIKRLVLLFINGLLKTNELQHLGRLKLLTVGGNLAPAESLYFSADYYPYFPMENYNLDPNYFLSPVYIDTNIDNRLDTWKYFFRHLGVQEDLVLLRFDNGNENQVSLEYKLALADKHRAHFNTMFFISGLTIKFIEITQFNVQFAIDFWEYVIKKINPSTLIRKDSLRSGRNFSVESLPHWFVRTRSCIPTTTNELRPSNEVFSDDLRPIARDFLPTFVVNIPKHRAGEWLNFFGFKSSFRFADYTAILQKIFIRAIITEITDEEEKHIQMVYKHLMDFLSKINNAELLVYKNQGSVALLSTLNKEFRQSNELFFCNDERVRLPMNVPQIKLSPENIENPQLSRFLTVMQIKQVRRTDLSLPADFPEAECFTLQKKFRHIQPFLFALADHLKLNNHAIDSDFEFLEADRLILFYKNEFPIEEVPLFVQGNKLFVQTNWTSDETMSLLPNALCELLHFPESAKEQIKQLLLLRSLEEMYQYFNRENIPIEIDWIDFSTAVTQGVREKFAEKITHENKHLFANLSISSSASPADLLLAGLEMQSSKWAGFVYHLTHLENAVKILSTGQLKARTMLETGEFNDSAAQKVIEETRNVIKSYVRFYFRPLTPTQGCNENLGLSNTAERFGKRTMCPVPVFFRINMKSLLNLVDLSWKVSLGNLASHHTKFDSTQEVVEQFDFNYVYADLRTERGKFSSQHEFLISSMLDLSQLNQDDITLIVQDRQAETTLRNLVQTLNYSVLVDSNYFFNINPYVSVQTNDENLKNVEICVVDNTEAKNLRGQLFVQIPGVHPYQSLTGQIIGVFQKETYLSIMGRNRIKLVLESASTPYAVYYRHDHQIWLIYTNHSDGEFKPTSSQDEEHLETNRNHQH